jgi:hypothetical protein
LRVHGKLKDEQRDNCIERSTRQNGISRTQAAIDAALMVLSYCRRINIDTEVSLEGNIRAEGKLSASDLEHAPSVESLEEFDNRGANTITVIELSVGRQNRLAISVDDTNLGRR